MTKAIRSLLCLTVLNGCTPPQVPVLEALPEPKITTESEFDPNMLESDPRLMPFTEKRGYPEYIIGPGDVMEITLRQVNLTTETVTVRPDSNISFGLVENVKAGGRTLAEIDRDLTSAVSQFIKEPKIDVVVTEYNSKRVSLLGAVESISTASQQTGQGQYSLTKKTKVLDIILEAGGTTQDAQLSKVQLTRSAKTYTLDLSAALSGDQSHNVVLQAEDIVRVPGSGASKRVVVIGEVTLPDVFLLSEDATLLDAMGQARGMTPMALRDDIRVIRSTREGAKMFGVNFDRITDDLDLRQNVALENNDIVYVPRSFTGDIAQTLDRVGPLLDILLLPASFRDLYTTGGGLRLDTGEPPESGSGSIFTRALPGTTPALKGAIPPEEETDEEDEEQE